MPLQVLTTVQVNDYEYTPDNLPLVNAEIFVWLSYDLATMAAPTVVLESKKLRTTTDAVGFWSLNLVPNPNITPANTLYTVKTPYRTYQISVPAGAGPYQASTIMVTGAGLLPANPTQIPGPLTIGPTGVGFNALGDITARSLTIIPSSPYTPNLPGATNTPTPAGVIAAKLYDYGGQVWNVKAFGALGDAKTVSDGAITSGQTTLTSASAGFTATDVGKSVGIAGAGAAGASLVTTITVFTNSTTVTVGVAAGTTVTNANVCWGTDNTTAINNAFTTAGVLGATIDFPAGGYIHATDALRPLALQRLRGEGATVTTFYPMGLNSGNGQNDGIRVTNAWNAYTNGLTVSDLTVDGTWQRGTAAGMTLQGIHNLALERCQVKNTNGFGIYIASINSSGVLGLGTQWKHARIKDMYITNSRLNDNFGGGGGVDCIFDRCWSDAPVTNGFDYTNMNDVWFHACRVTATTGTPTAFASDFGMQGAHYIDCIAAGAGIQYGFTVTDNTASASSQGHAFDITYSGCHVRSIAVNPFWLKSNGVGQHVDRVTINRCDITSTAAAGIYAQGCQDLNISDSILQVGAGQFAVSLDSDSGGVTTCANGVIRSNDMAGTKGVQQIAAVTQPFFIDGNPGDTGSAIPSQDSAPANPVGTASGAGVMMGLAVLFTPRRTGKLKITVTGTGANSVATDGFTIQLRTGTGGAPGNGVAAAGTVAGANLQGTSATAAALVPIALDRIVSGLTVGIQIWIDLLLAAITGGTATLTNLDVVVQEI
jgi:hypothetical protein